MSKESNASSAPVRAATLDRPSASQSPDLDMVWIDGGRFTMGSNEHYPEEAPAHRVWVDGFWIDRYQVTNARFRRFVKATGYLTVAERVPQADDYPGAIPAELVAGSVVFSPPAGRVSLANHYTWWAWVHGANWLHPEGPGSNLQGRDKHPVLHVAWEDVCAYAAWTGKALPTEAEWERAARGGHDGWVYAWGEELAPNGRMLANYWQGEFPWHNLVLDGFGRSAPVGSFPPNDYGLFDMIGNAWEWTSDWYVPHPPSELSCCSGAAVNPPGAIRAASIDPLQPGAMIPRKVLKGGSYACAENYCQRYRPAARMAHPIDTGTSHIGFRCVVRPERTERAGGPTALAQDSIRI
jgi:formylglycine-generating enzyme required for sulfatase activity